jgi:hypothetical protein
MHEHYKESAFSLIGKVFGDRTVVKVVRKKSISNGKDKFSWFFELICSKGHESCIRKCEFKSVCLKCYVPKNKKSDLRGTSIYNIWKSMRQRCMNPRSYDYKYYGARGISICERWNVFTNFFEDMGHKPEGKSLDRIDNNKGYSPKNCRWATQKEQINNSRKIKRD